MAPPPIGDLGGWAARDLAAYEGFEEAWYEARERSLRFASQYGRVARVRGVPFLDAGDHVTSSDVDGIHWGPEGHAALGLAVAEAVQVMLP